MSLRTPTTQFCDPVSSTDVELRCVGRTGWEVSRRAGGKCKDDWAEGRQSRRELQISTEEKEKKSGRGERDVRPVC